jgi:regulator of sigma E protease
MSFLSYFLTIAGIGFLIFIHELGHFLFCKLFQIPVAAFKIGRGPEFFSKKINNTIYSIGMLPFGGYVAIGETNEHEKEVDIISEKPFYQGSLVILGGILNNIIFSYITIISIYILKPECFIKTPLKTFLFQKPVLIKKENEIIETQYHSIYALSRDITKKNKLNIKDQEPINISPDTFKTTYHIEENFSFPENKIDRLIEGAKLVSATIKSTIIGLIESFSSAHFKNFSGPIGIIKTCTTAAESGILIFFTFLALISISLGILNLLPIPIVDGGQLLLLAIRKIYKKNLPDNLQSILTYISFGILGTITIYSTYNDIIRYIFN